MNEINEVNDINEIKEINIIMTCPNIYCKDNVPQDPPKNLVDMLHKYATLEKTEGKFGSGASRLAFDICMAISAERKKQWSIEASKTWGWPVYINFSTLPERIMLMKPELDNILTDVDAKKEYCNWDFLLEDNGGDIDTLHKTIANMKSAMSSKAFSTSRPG